MSPDSAGREASVKERPSLEAAVRVWAAEAQRGLEFHLSPQDLLDYHAGDVTGDERERIQDHLALCSVCARALLDLESFPIIEPLREEDRLSDPALAAEWRRFEERTRAIPFSRSAKKAVRTSPWLPLALAASLLAVLGLSVWAGLLRRDLSAPRVDVYVADLTPHEESRERSAAGEDGIRVPDWAHRILLILNLTKVPPFPEYRVEIVPLGREVVWDRRGIRPNPDGNFTLEVPRRLLAAAPHRVRLYGLHGNASTLVAEYRVRIEE
jgi:hypothetical protein